MTRVLDSPTTTLGKQHALIYLGREGELAHAMPRAACAQLVPPAQQHLALRRDEDRTRAWLKEMMTFFSTDEILALDETAIDRLAYRSTIDWDLRCGTNRPHSRSSPYAVSRTGVSMTGFVSGTRDARRESCHLL